MLPKAHTRDPVGYFCPYAKIGHRRTFFIYITGKINYNKIQYSVPSTAEIDMTSFGSDYGRHLTRSLTLSL